MRRWPELPYNREAKRKRAGRELDVSASASLEDKSSAVPSSFSVQGLGAPARAPLGPLVLEEARKVWTVARAREARDGAPQVVDKELLTAAALPILELIYRLELVALLAETMRPVYQVNGLRSAVLQANPAAKVEILQTCHVHGTTRHLAVEHGRIPTCPNSAQCGCFHD